MKDFPSCFGENGVQVGEASSSSETATITTKNAQNLVTCVYQCKMHNASYIIITLTWTKNLMGQSLSVEINDSNNQSLGKLDIKPWLFSKRRGYRTLEACSKMINIYWDLTYAKFGPSSPEPITGFYLAIAMNRELVLVVGDMNKEVHKKINQIQDATSLAPKAVFVSKRAHIFGKKTYSTRAQFCGKGQVHEILIECDGMGVNDDSCLMIRIDGNPVMQVKCLRWKFRGNYTILVDGLPVEVYWDVHSWLFEKWTGNAVFLFKTCVSAEKLWPGDDECWSRMLSKDGQMGFCLVLCVWKSE